MFVDWDECIEYWRWYVLHLLTRLEGDGIGNICAFVFPRVRDTCHRNDTAFPVRVSSTWLLARFINPSSIPVSPRLCRWPLGAHCSARRGPVRPLDNVGRLRGDNHPPRHVANLPPTAAAPSLDNGRSLDRGRTGLASLPEYNLVWVQQSYMCCREEATPGMAKVTG